MVNESVKKELLRSMLRLRLIEERLAEIYHFADEMKTPMHLYTGQEAVAVGVCQALQKEDVVGPYHRSHGWYLAKGGNLKAMIAELFGKSTGCCKGWGGSMHLVDVPAGVMGSSAILAASIPHLAGCALAFQLKKEPRVAVAPFGDAAVEEGVYHETMNWASLKKLPVVFVCENNFYSCSTPLNERQPSVEIYKRAQTYGMPSIKCDGNNVSEVYEAAMNAVARARKGDGPSFIEVMTYRWREHCGPEYDWGKDVHTKQEGDQWMANCPIKKLAAEFPANVFKDFESQINKEIDEAIDFARQSSFPEVCNEIL